MQFEWDEQKRASNIEKHGIDFRRAAEIFDGRPAIEFASHVPAETRFVRVAMAGDRYIAVVWTSRGDTVRIISARMARDNEKRAYRDLLAR